MLLLGLNLTSPELSLQATSMHISSLHIGKRVAARKVLESLENWSGHGLSNRTGSASPEREAIRMQLAVKSNLEPMAYLM